MKCYYAPNWSNGFGGDRELKKAPMVKTIPKANPAINDGTEPLNK